MVRRVDREKTVSRKEVEEPKLGKGKDKRKWNGEVRSEVRWRLNGDPERGCCKLGNRAWRLWQLAWATPRLVEIYRC